MVRPLSPDSARVANDLIDANYPAQEITEAVNWRRTPQGQGTLAELGAMASSWRRNYLPADPAPYSADDVRGHRQNRASGSGVGPSNQRHWSSVPPKTTTFDGAHLDGSFVNPKLAAAHQASNAQSPLRLGEVQVHPLEALAAMYPTYKGSISGRGIKNVGKYVELGNPGPLPQPLNMGRITFQNGLLGESTYADIAKAGFRRLPQAQQEALRNYTGFSYREINAALRTGARNARTKIVIAAIRNASHEIAPGTILSRMIDVESPKDLRAIIQSTGKILQDRAIVSTSINPLVNFYGNVHMKLTIGPKVRGLYTGPGTDPEGGAISVAALDQEILLPENTRLHIQKVEQAPQVFDADNFGFTAKYIVHAYVLPTSFDRHEPVADLLASTANSPATHSSKNKMPKFLSFLRKRKP
jgi:hypothetical protein